MKKTYGVLVAVVLLTTACGGSKKAAATSTGAAAAPSSTTAGATAAGATAGATSATVQSGQYLTAADALDAAYARWRSAIVGKNRVAQLTGPAASYALALTTFDNAISRVNASGKTATDIQTLVAADAVVIADLNSITRQTEATLSSWSAKLSADGAPARVAGDTVRTDFGLPLPTS